MKLFLVSLAVATAGIAAAQPANDNCSGATLITPGPIGTPCTPVSGTSVGATPSSTFPSCEDQANVERDVWYRFVATAPDYTVSMQNVTNTNPLANYLSAYGLTIYSGNCSALSEIGCDGGLNGVLSDPATITVNGLIPGNTYYVQIWKSLSFDASGNTLTNNNINFGVCLTATPPPPPPPVNDICSGALPIFGTTPITGSTSSATNDVVSNLVSCGSSSVGITKGLWYKLSPAVTGELTVATCGSAFDTYLRVYSGSCGAFTSCEGYNDDSTGCGGGFSSSSMVTFDAVAGTEYYVLLGGYGNATGFGNFNLSVTGVPLEVKMGILSGTITGNNQALLRWNTYNERNNKGFEIQRSTDGKNFGYAGFVPSLGTKGNSNTEQAYSFNDPAPATGRLYYRLKQTDYDNSTTYSNTISLAAGATAFSLIATPNPVHDRLNIQIQGRAPMARIQITDLSGKVCRSIQLNDLTTTIDMSSLASGIYVLKYTDALQTQTIKVQKQ